MEKRNIRMYMKEPAVKSVLGPGERFCLWLQGCHKNCPGCTAQGARDPTGGRLIPAEALAMEIVLSHATGLTISGGEPMLQAHALAEMLAFIKKRKAMDVILYTGYLREELPDIPGAETLVEYIDLLVDGPYIKELDDGASLRGSSNQRVIALSSRGEELLPYFGIPNNRLTERFVHAGEVHYVGIANFAQKLKGEEKI